MLTITGDVPIAAPRARVFAALDNPGLLARAIPGCEALERIEDGQLRATIVVKLGVIKARFTGLARVDEAVAPERFLISGEGEGGLSGSARGRCVLTLAERGGETDLRYRLEVDVVGRIASLGARAIEPIAHAQVRAFVNALSALLGENGGSGERVGATPTDRNVVIAQADLTGALPAQLLALLRRERYEGYAIGAMVGGSIVGIVAVIVGV